MQLIYGIFHLFFLIKLKHKYFWALWDMSIMPATEETEARASQVPG